MMDPATARLALKIQLDDIDAILKTLPPSSEAAAFMSLRGELIRKWQEVSGQYFAYSILKEENNHRVAFTRLLSEEQQAERDHDMACRLAGVPVPKRVAQSNKRAADGEADADGKSEAVSGPMSGVKKPRVDLNGTQTSAPPPKPSVLVKRPAEDQLTPGGKNASNFKRARVEDDTEGDPRTATPQSKPPASSKRVAFIDPAVLREEADGHTKRAKSDTTQENPRVGLDGGTVARPTAVPTPSSGDGKTKCSSCLDEHPKRDMLQLPCKGKDESDTHAYCRDCLPRLFESSVTDPSHFPPRCCSKIIPVFSCIPFLPPSLFARFVAKREELETVNRTYCSNTTCSKWIRPAHIQGNMANCPECSHKTCTTCKGKHHVGLCPEDKGVKELMKVARRKRWQTCPNCKEMVELERGCYHITCRCRHEFCYLCLAKWQTCKCPAWDERNIINDPQLVVGPAQQAPAPVVNPMNIPPPNPPAVMYHPALNSQPAAYPGAPGAFVNHAPAGYFNHAPAAYPNHPPAAFAGFGSAYGPHAAAPVCAYEGHDFERYYRSMDWNTVCDLCGHEDRWVNCCAECDLKVCWYCTKHRV